VILQILGHLQMRLEHGDRLLDIEFHIRIALELPLRTLERAESFLGKCCNFENGDGGGPERNWAARFQAARSNSWSMN
jgi:hypothetical protein